MEVEATPEVKEQLRFELELEFVQSLANPFYLQFLAQRLYFEDPAFVAYLSYLRYWRTQEYARFVTFPNCLVLLELLQASGSSLFDCWRRRSSWRCRAGAEIKRERERERPLSAYRGLFCAAVTQFPFFCCRTLSSAPSLRARHSPRRYTPSSCITG